jgi:hypothetical protein
LRNPSGGAHQGSSRHVAQHPRHVFFYVPTHVLAQPTDFGGQHHIAGYLDIGR